MARSCVARHPAPSHLGAIRSRSRLLRGLTAALLASLGALAVGCAADSDVGNAASTDGDDVALHAAARSEGIRAALRAFPEARVLSESASGTPRFVEGDLGRVALARDAAATDLRPALARIAPAFGASAGGLTLRRASRDERGALHFRIDQTRNGLRVHGAELIVHVRGDVIEGANGKLADDLAAPTEPRIDADAAVTAAITASVEATPDLAEITETSAAPALAYYLDGEELRLVYEAGVKGFAKDGLPLDDTVLVDAVDGSVRLRMPHIHTAKNRQMYDANHGTSIPGTLKRSEGGSATGDSVIDNNYSVLGSTYDCYQSLFGRDSWNGSGGALKSSLHYGSASADINNAFWTSSGNQLAFGDGDGSHYAYFGSYMDVVAHEFGHGVTQAESSLVYSGESGGLNEGMSDIFGAACEWWADGQVLSADTWKVGEDAYTSGDALRYMNDPAADGASADHYADYSSSMDVHYSSGIANLAFYLLAVGGAHPRGASTTVVIGVGMLKAAKIFYTANANYLTSSASFSDARTATVAAAKALYGDSTALSVSQAWDAVGVARQGITASVTPGTGNWGSWRSSAYCPDGMWANGYALRVEGSQGGSGDDTALNAVRLYCSNASGTMSTYVSSHDGWWGSWGSSATCSSGSFLGAAKMRIEGSQGGGDDTSANDVRFTCTNGAEIAVTNGMGWGSWGSYTSCPSGSAVCGLSIRLEDKQGSGDDTAMNGPTVHCCSL